MHMRRQEGGGVVACLQKKLGGQVGAEAGEVCRAAAGVVVGLLPLERLHRGAHPRHPRRNDFVVICTTHSA